MAHNSEAEQAKIDLTVESYRRNGGNIRATAKELGISRDTVLQHARKAGLRKKPVAAGRIDGVETRRMPLPEEGKIARYILTSAQNNTYVNDTVWKNLLALAGYYDATLLVGTYSY